MAGTLAEQLRLCLVTDGRGDQDRIERVVDAVLAAGGRCVQLREPGWTARQLWRACERLRPRVHAARGLLLVNDRVDVAAAGAAHGVQLGHRSLPPEVARAVLGPDAVIGCSVHDAAELGAAQAAGCDFALLSPVWPTPSKPGAPGLGVAAAGKLTRAARVPTVWLGGVDPTRCEAIAALPAGQRPAGVAALSALMQATDPAVVAAALLRAF